MNIGQLQRDAASGLWFRLRTPVPAAPRANGLALGVPQTRLRYEFFGPLETLQAA
jgi:nitric oxide dioxygenase